MCSGKNFVEIELKRGGVINSEGESCKTTFNSVQL